MNNELTQDAEESATIEKTAVETTESTTATAEAAAPTATETPAEPAAAETAPAAEAPAAPEPAKAPVQADADDDDAAGSGEIDFGAILEQFEQEQTVYHQGELVEGKIVGVTDRGVLVDFGY